MKRVYLVLTVDVECDKDPDWRVRRPLTFRSVREGIVERLVPLCEDLGLRPTLLLSPEVIRDDAAVDLLGNLEDCELGTHAHIEFLEPHADWNASRTDGVLTGLPPDVEREKLTNLTEMFRRRFGRNPTGFRAGRFALSPRTLPVLAALGYRVDTTVTPFKTWSFNEGPVLNYWGAPPWPYRPSPADFRRCGSSPLWEVPVTIAVSALLSWPRWMVRLLGQHPRWRERLLRALGPGARAVWLRPLRSKPDELIQVSDAVIRVVPDGRPAVLNMMFHSVELIPGASPYAQTETDVAALLDSIRLLAEHLTRRYAARASTLSEVPSLTE